MKTVQQEGFFKTELQGESGFDVNEQIIYA
jgi:hypothetical protein